MSPPVEKIESDPELPGEVDVAIILNSAVGFRYRLFFPELFNP